MLPVYVCVYGMYKCDLASKAAAGWSNVITRSDGMTHALLRATDALVEGKNAYTFGSDDS